VTKGSASARQTNTQAMGNQLVQSRPGGLDVTGMLTCTIWSTCLASWSESKSCRWPPWTCVCSSSLTCACKVVYGISMKLMLITQQAMRRCDRFMGPLVYIHGAAKPLCAAILHTYGALSQLRRVHDVCNLQLLRYRRVISSKACAWLRVDLMCFPHVPSSTIDMSRAR
jgi:hypothetical protein